MLRTSGPGAHAGSIRGRAAGNLFPILYLMAYTDFDAALALHNAVPQGLSSAIFTNDLREAERFLSASGSDCGIANVNVGPSGAEIGGAFGARRRPEGSRSGIVGRLEGLHAARDQYHQLFPRPSPGPRGPVLYDTI